MKIYHGNIITLDQDNHIYNYLVENRGYIEYVGDELPSKYHNQDIIELGQKALIPSFAYVYLQMME